MEPNFPTPKILSELEERIWMIFRILPEASMRREEIHQHGPHSISEFDEWNQYCVSLDAELGTLLRKLEACLKQIHWEGSSLPSPHYPDLWKDWWQAVRRKTTNIQKTLAVKA